MEQVLAMSQTIEPLKIDFPELFSSLDREGFACVEDGEEGIRIYADQLEYDEGVLSFKLLITYTFTRLFTTRFERMAKAIVISVEDASTGKCRVVNLLDPHKKYPQYRGLNYNPDRIAKSQGKKTSYREIPVEIAMGKPGWGPHFFIRAQLQKFNSNILALKLGDKVELTSFWNGSAYTVKFKEASND